MTVQAGIELDLDIATLVGEFEEQACEHSQHQTNRNAHGDEAASHYIQGFCVCAGWSDAYAACPKFVAHIQEDSLNRCPQCGHLAPRNEIFKVLGPINSFTR